MCLLCIVYIYIIIVCKSTILFILYLICRGPVCIVISISSNNLLSDFYFIHRCGKPDFSYSSPDINSTKPSDQVQSFTPELIHIKPNKYPVQQPGHYHSSENYQYHDEHYSTTTSLTEESSAHQQQQHKFYSQYGIDSEQSICAGVFSSPIETLGSSIVGSRCHSVVDSCSPVKNLRCDFPFSPLDNVL